MYLIGNYIKLYAMFFTKETEIISSKTYYFKLPNF